MHNRKPHEPRHPRIERAVFRTVLRLSDAILLHSEYARTEAIRAFGHSERMTVVPHPNYDGVYPPPRRGRALARADLGLPNDGFVFLLFGHIRAYKRIPEAIRAFSAVQSLDATFVVAGTLADDDLALEIAAAVAEDPRVKLIARRISDDEIADLHLAADAAVFAYRDVFSSGALLLALSYGLPVVAPAVGTAAEIVLPAALIAFGEGGLTSALNEARDRVSAVARHEARVSAEQFGWDEFADRTLAIYRRVIERRTAQESARAKRRSR